MKNVDTSGFRFKTRAVKRAFAFGAVKVMLESAQEVHDRTAKNLKGPQMHPRIKRDGKGDLGIGKWPIPRRTGNLARSETLTPLSSVDYAIWMNPKIAPYAGFVHDGTKYVKPRRYLKNVIDERGAAIINRIRYQLLKAIRSEGR